MSDALDVEEFIVGYLAEVDEHLATARACLVAVDGSLKKGETNPKSVRDLFRALHTIKGLSAMVGAEPIVDISHELETLLRAADRAGGRLPARAVDTIVRSLRAIEERVASLSKRESLAAAPKDLLEALAAVQLGSGPALQAGTLNLDAQILNKLTSAEQEQLLQGLAKGRPAKRIDFIPSKERADRGVTITSVRTNLSAVGEVVKVVPRSISAGEGHAGSVAFVLLVLTAATDEALAAIADVPVEAIVVIDSVAGVDAPNSLTGEEAEGPEPEPATVRNVVRVEVARLDRALEELSTLIVTRTRMQRAVSALAAGTGSVREVNAILVENGRQLRDLRAAIMRARMVPVAELLERTPLLVRGISRSVGKQVQLEIDAGRAELDKSVADRLGPAILHLLRNAVDHAIEHPEARKRLGKPAEGHIAISCVASSGSHLTLTITDDGAGIDASKVAARAGAAVPPDDAGLLALITRPGLSTSDQTTTTSGRGLGMDIVKRIVVTDLGGTLELQTTRDVGTRFTLTVPVTVTILDAFTFVSAGRVFVIPVSAVEDLVEIEPTHLVSAPSPGSNAPGARMLRHRLGTLPLFALGALLGLPGDKVERPKAIIVLKNGRRFAFEVDRMLSQQEIVVRPLKDPLVQVRGVSGSTDLGDGQPTLVLDLPALVEAAPARAEVRS